MHDRMVQPIGSGRGALMTIPGPQVSRAEIAGAEDRLGLRLPSAYADWLLETNGLEGWFGEQYLMLYSLADIVEVTEAAEAAERFANSLVIGSDGGGELMVLDLRHDPAPVVILNTTAAGWAEGCLQASSFDEFLAQRERGEPFRWEDGYA